jgi:Mce-associated membrane protein
MADTLVVSPATPETATAPHPAPQPSSTGLRRTFTVLVCVVVALIALLVVELVRGPSRSGTQSLSTGASSGNPSDPSSLSNAALQAAIDEAPTLFSYNYQTIDKDLAAASADTTGAFTSQLAKVSGPAVKPLAIKYKVVVTAKVLAATVVDSSNLKQIKVMLFLDQVVKNTQLAAPRLDANRTILTMVPVGKGWKVAGVSAI